MRVRGLRQGRQGESYLLGEMVKVNVHKEITLTALTELYRETLKRADAMR